MRINLYPKVQRDLDNILAHYEAQSGSELADAFFNEFEVKIAMVLRNPKAVHYFEMPCRRVNLDRFPYHFLYRELNLVFASWSSDTISDIHAKE